MNRISEIPKDVREVIELLLIKVKGALNDKFIGMYIHGSLALGDFNPNSSDIDFFVITKGEISKEEFSLLKQIHNDILSIDNKWGKRLEGSYIDMETLKSITPPTKPRPYINGEEFHLANHGYEWILEEHVTREHGIIIEGPNPKELIMSISLEDLREGNLKILNDWWAPMVTYPLMLKDSEYQAYAVLSMCRIIYTFTYGIIVSKKKASSWAQRNLEKEWENLIKEAMEWKKGYAFNNFHRTLEFIKFTLELVNRVKGNID